MIWDNARWQKIIIDRYGKYLLLLTSYFRPEMLYQSPAFNLVLAISALADTEEPYTVDFKIYMNVEGTSQDNGHLPVADGNRNVILIYWTRMDNSLNHHERQL